MTYACHGHGFLKRDLLDGCLNPLLKGPRPSQATNVSTKVHMRCTRRRNRTGRYPGVSFWGKPCQLKPKGLVGIPMLRIHHDMSVRTPRHRLISTETFSILLAAFTIVLFGYLPCQGVFSGPQPPNRKAPQPKPSKPQPPREKPQGSYRLNRPYPGRRISRKRSNCHLDVQSKGQSNPGPKFQGRGCSWIPAAKSWLDKYQPGCL